MLVAAVDTVAELGYPRMTVSQVVARAGVSRKTFYDMFAGREDCFLAAFEQIVFQASLLARGAYERELTWCEAVRSALSRLLMFIDDERGRARLVVVESLAAGPTVLDRRTELLAQLAQIIDDGRLSADTATDPPPLTAEGVVGSVFAVLYARLLERSEEPLTGLLGPLMRMIVLPYLGAEAAGRELARPTRPRRGRVRSRGESRSVDVLGGLDMRLTYRTVRVLTAIAEHPGASNREVAEAADVVDAGQISKLLNRLAGLSLIESSSDDRERRAPKAWRLTALGAQLERATRLRDSGVHA